MPSAEKILAEALSLATHLVAVRVVAVRRGLALKFRNFAFGSLKVHQFDVRQVAEIILARSEDVGADRAKVLRDAVLVHAELCALAFPPVGDHDLFAALARTLDRFGVKVSDSTLLRAFIVAASVSCTALGQTRWFREIQDWCESENRIGFNCSSVTTAA